MTRPMFKELDGLAYVDGLPSPRPCPFCGNDALPVPDQPNYVSPIWMYSTAYTDGTGRFSYTVQCGRCHAEGPFQLSPEYAAYTWNKRALEAVDPATARERALPGVSLH